MASIVLSKKNFDHPWLYKSLIKTAPAGVVAGEIVDVTNASGAFLGKAYYNPKSEIAGRVLTRENRKIDVTFFKEKFSRALDYRKRFVKNTDAYRLVSSEGDDLPGLIVDRYSDVLVVQFLTLGMERLREPILQALEEVVPAKGLYEKSDSNSRVFEGLDKKTGWLRRDCGSEIEVYEGSVRYRLDLEKGHKTGLYLDQRQNRFILKEFAPKGKVLDAFCYTGGFGLHLAGAGRHVTGLDQSAEALAQARENRKASGLAEQDLDFREGNVFDILKEYDKAKERFDMVILDPPSFVKRKKELEGAVAGYNEIVLRSLKILNPSSQLALFSCSYHVDENLLMQIVLSAAQDARRSVKVLQFLKQSVDHPINPLVPETYYLKGFLFFVI